MELQYASNGKGNLGVTLGAIGTGLSVLNGGLNGILGNGIGAPMNGYNNILAQKDMEISQLRSENFTNSKVIDLERQLCAYKQEQAVINAQLSNAIAVNTNNLDNVMSLTKTVIPTDSIYSVSSSI